jgi:ABC-type multidrug transport system ATPase subunit
MASLTLEQCFDKVTVIYEGRQIFFGKTTAAKQFFVDLGFECPARQTDADFLTSLTSPAERVVREGYESRVPKTPDEFAAVWKASAAYAGLLRDIEEYDREHAIGGPKMEAFRAARRAQQAKGARASSPYTLSYGGQITLCLSRGFQRLRGCARWLALQCAC